MEKIKIDLLKENKNNPRKISAKKLDELVISIKENPEYFEARPIICDKNMIIWAGHQRYKAAKKLGLKTVPCVIMDLPEKKMQEIMIRDNNNSGEWDTQILVEDWNVDDLKLWGLEFRENEISEQEQSIENTKKKKLKKCPHCGEEI